MHKQVEIIAEGKLVPLGPDMVVSRVIPNHYIQSVGPYVFLDHMVPTIMSPDSNMSTKGTGAHPHRGIITFTYLFSGEVEHFDSRGNHSIVKAGGIQWMKAGNGIIHDEGPSAEFQQSGGTLHGLQLWVNLPAINKAEEPEYEGLQSEDVPEVLLPNASGKLRILLGEYDGEISPLKTYSKQVYFHIQLLAGKSFQLDCVAGYEYGIYITESHLQLRDKVVKGNEFATFTEIGNSIEMENTTDKTLDIMLFGGEPIHEPKYADGPFVMNTLAEIGTAYRDFYAGKYGIIDKSKLNN